MDGGEAAVDPRETGEHAESEAVKNGASIKEQQQQQELDEEQQQEEEELEQSKKRPPQGMIRLQTHLTAFVTDIQTAAHAKELMRRTEVEEARRIRLELLERSVKSSEEGFEEVVRGWSMAKEEAIPQKLQDVLNSQQQLCSALVEHKKKVISDLQQELKAADDRYVKDLRKHAEELELMVERMKEQIKTLTKAYREELLEMERLCQQESKVFLTGDGAEWEHNMKRLWDKEMERLTRRKKQVEDNENTIHSLMLDAINRDAIHSIQQKDIDQIRERQNQERKGSNMLVGLKSSVHKYKAQAHKLSSHSLKRETRNLEDKLANQTEGIRKRNWRLSEDHKRSIQQNERIQKKIKPFAAADARKYKAMWLMLEAEVKQLVERALVIDSLICKQHLGSSWERPRMTFTELSRPTKPQKQAHGSTEEAGSQLFQTGQGLQRSQGSMETRDESTGVTKCTAGTEVQSESSAEVEELSPATLKEVMELLCDEAGFVMEDKLLKLLAPLEKQEQTVVRLGSLVSSLGIEKEDLPKLALFLLKYTQQQTEDVQPGASGVPAEAVEATSETNLSSGLVRPNDVLPALKRFLEQRMRSSGSSCQQSSVMHFEAWDSSECEAYWQSMGSTISKDRVRLWEAAEKTLKQHLSVLTEISELVPETERLEQQNAELRLLLQHSLKQQ